MTQDLAAARRIAACAGPWLFINGAAEILNRQIFAAQTAPVVYLNGGLLLAGGLVILRSYRSWRPGWPLLVTLTGWIFALGGTARMVVPEVQLAGASDGATIASSALTGVIGIVLTWQAYLRQRVT